MLFLLLLFDIFILKFRVEGSKRCLLIGAGTLFKNIRKQAENNQFR